MPRYGYTEIDNLPARLLRLRKEAKKSQAKLARDAKVDQRTISMMELGHNHNPSLFILLKLSDALGVSIHELVSDD